jgi:7-carboxy-7-deazaguanine synthase
VKKYAVKEMFLTIQGEGTFAGSRAVFVRFTGCNVWNGREEDRARDTEKGYCAEWCDTDFVGTDGERGGVYTKEELVEEICELWVFKTNGSIPGMVVFTGGEPALQLDGAITMALHEKSFRVHVETNGSSPLPDHIGWVTVSPKWPMPVRIIADEVKVVLPCPVDPEAYRLHGSNHFVQPRDYGNPNDPRSLDALDLCKKYVMTHIGWRLSLQTHKIAKMP